MLIVIKNNYFDYLKFLLSLIVKVVIILIIAMKINKYFFPGNKIL